MHTVHVKQENRTVPANEDETLEQVADRENIGIPFGCKNGICGTCIIKIDRGMEHLSPKEPKERNTLEMFGAGEEHRLACQCHVHGDVDINEP